LNTITAYADDITIIITSSTEANQVKNIFQNFQEVSGAKLNYNKIMAIKFGNFTPLSWLQIKPERKILGKHFIENLQKVAISNWNMNKLWFMSAILPANNQMRTRITNIVDMFIWRSHPLANDFTNKKGWQESSIARHQNKAFVYFQLFETQQQ
jgi:hypothetical protein